MSKSNIIKKGSFNYKKNVNSGGLWTASRLSGQVKNRGIKNIRKAKKSK